VALLRKLLLPFLVLSFSTASAQEAKSNDTIGVGVVTYPFYYTTELTEGSIAVGPSVVMEGDKWAMELSVPVDLKEYYVWEGGHIDARLTKYTNVFIAFMFHYSYLSLGSKAHLFATGGMALGGRYYEDDNFTEEKSTNFNVLAGTGLSFRLIKYIEARALINIRYGDRLFSPGVFINLLVPIALHPESK
jgi:hypothetical protein